jgi:long-chain acyl-CoA synthetase
MIFIVLDPDRINIYAKTNGLDNNATICESEPLRKLIWKDIYRIANENNFNSLEKPKQMKLIFDLWTTESDMLTPTMKLKRNIAKERYADEIENMYKQGPLNYEPKK